MSLASGLWLVAFCALMLLGLLIIGNVLRGSRLEGEDAQHRAHRLRRFADQLTQGGLTGAGLGTEVLGVFQGRKVRLALKEDPRSREPALVFVLTVAPRSLTELDVSKAGWRPWLLRAGRKKQVLEVSEKLVLERGERDHLEGLFMDGRMEQVLEELFGLGFDRLTLRSNMLKLEKPLASDPRLEHVERVFHCLREVAWLCEGKEVRLQALGDEVRRVWTAGTNQPLCPYCRDVLATDADALEACPECLTVHHADCFTEAGGCTVFGCSAAPARELA